VSRIGNPQGIKLLTRLNPETPAEFHSATQHSTTVRYNADSAPFQFLTLPPDIILVQGEAIPTSL